MGEEEKDLWDKLVRLETCLKFRIITNENGSEDEEILDMATELYDCANELRYRARQMDFPFVERYALRAMDFSDTVTADYMPH